MDDVAPGDLEITCAESGKHIYTVHPETGVEVVASGGQCEGCGDFFSIECLVTPDGMKPSRWPIRYSGYYCKECYDRSI